MNYAHFYSIKLHRNRARVSALCLYALTNADTSGFSKMINVSIYGEHTLSVESVSRLLEDESELNLYPAAVKSFNPHPHLKQDVLVYCAKGYSNSLVKEIKKSHSIDSKIKKVLIISMAHKHFLKKLLNAGVNSILSYKSSPEELIQAVKCATLNQQFLSSDLSKMIIKSKYPSPFNTLSQRELEITYLLANGMNIKCVSSELDISPKTVNTYRYRIFDKLAINRNIDLYRKVSEEASYMLNTVNQ